VIIVVEGPSAAGKTSWIDRHVDGPVVAEASVINPPDRMVDPLAAAIYWASVSARRWAEACSLEQTNELVVCDCDPFKLHYVWSLWMIGLVRDEQWRTELQETRSLFATHALGLADYVYIRVPTAKTLSDRARNDPTRTRSNFPVHAQLAEPLTAWYKAIARLDSNRVRWEFPSDGLPRSGLTSRSERTGVALFDHLMSFLPAI
jgi:hypothetical protein